MTSFESIYNAETHSFKIPEDIRGNTLFQLFGLYLMILQIARQPDKLPSLKGSVSNVLSVIAMHVDKQTRATYIGVRRMVKESGYQSQAVVNALRKLEALGFIERTRLSHDRMLYRMVAPFAAAKAPEDKSEPEGEDSGESKQARKKAEPASAASGGKIALPPSVASNPPTPTATVAEEKSAPETQPLPLPPEWVAVENELMKAGIIASVAKELVALLRERKREPAYAHGWMKVYYARREVGEVKSPGWLRTCLQKDDPVPDKLTIAEPELSELEKWQQELNDPYWGQFYSR